MQASVTPLALTAAHVRRFRVALSEWYRANARVLPWRETHDPFAIWVSEIMLQQTRVAAVLEHYRRFLARFPTVAALAAASQDDVIAQWSGLGYYRRARMLHNAAQAVVAQHGGNMPATYEGLLHLPGIGSYTAAAIASIAHGERVAAVDGNVERVLLRVTGGAEEKGAKAAAGIRALAQSLVPAVGAGDHTQAMMELGATVCTPRSPRCEVCPVFALCVTRGEHPTLKRAPALKQHIHYGLLTRVRNGADEVLMQRRSDTASIMPRMLELPQLAGAGEPEPVVRLSHGITTTSYTVDIHRMRGLTEMRSAVMVTDRLVWVGAATLGTQPLTGLARKALRRLGLMHP